MKNLKIIGLILCTPILLSSFGEIKENDFEVVKIGTQIWTAKNLDVDHFRNGDKINEATSKEEWAKFNSIGQPAWKYYAENAGHGVKFGKLYNDYAMRDSRGLAPEGYHIPSVEEWTVLFDELGGEEIEALVIADYQIFLEKQWIDLLKKKYDCKINYDVLNEVK